jgi:hypothetical protein
MEHNGAIFCLSGFPTMLERQNIFEKGFRSGWKYKNFTAVRLKFM